ncbi:MAG: hypothetical protein KatS3mg110_3016 [Pirellulaceae bacterium]|nr:MAG: hypothetical protein KatS3mg110_3016 [Pirellulaceae bacterium]
MKDSLPPRLCGSGFPRCGRTASRESTFRRIVPHKGKEETFRFDKLVDQQGHV